MKIDKNIIKELTDYLNEFNLTEIEYTEKDTKIKVSKSTNTVSANSSVATQLTPSLNKEISILVDSFPSNINFPVISKIAI